MTQYRSVNIVHGRPYFLKFALIIEAIQIVFSLTAMQILKLRVWCSFNEQHFSLSAIWKFACQLPVTMQHRQHLKNMRRHPDLADYISPQCKLLVTWSGPVLKITAYPDARDSRIWGRTADYEKMPVLVTVIYFHLPVNLRTTNFQVGPPSLNS